MRYSPITRPMLKPSSTQLSWAALLVAVAALAVALSAGAVGLPGTGTVDENDLQRNAVRSKHVKKDEIGALRSVQAGGAPPHGPARLRSRARPGQVRERDSRGVDDDDVSANNGFFCISGIGFAPKHVQVTPQAADAVPHVFLRETVACTALPPSDSTATSATPRSSSSRSSTREAAVANLRVRGSGGWSVLVLATIAGHRTGTSRGRALRPGRSDRATSRSGWCVGRLAIRKAACGRKPGTAEGEAGLRRSPPAQKRRHRPVLRTPRNGLS